MDPKQQLEETAAFLREHRSNEANFEKLLQRLQEELNQNQNNGAYTEALKEAAEKTANAYRQAKGGSGSAWPEFEKFVSDWEKALMKAINEPS